MASTRLADCDICSEESASNIQYKPCSHYSCFDCFIKLRQANLFKADQGVRCPFCRQYIEKFVPLEDSIAQHPGIEAANNSAEKAAHVRRMAALTEGHKGKDAGPVLRNGVIMPSAMSTGVAVALPPSQRAPPQPPVQQPSPAGRGRGGVEGGAWGQQVPAAVGGRHAQPGPQQHPGAGRGAGRGGWVPQGQPPPPPPPGFPHAKRPGPGKAPGGKKAAAAHAAGAPSSNAISFPAGLPQLDLEALRASMQAVTAQRPSSPPAGETPQAPAPPKPEQAEAQKEKEEAVSQPSMSLLPLPAPGAAPTTLVPDLATLLSSLGIAPPPAIATNDKGSAPSAPPVSGFSGLDLSSLPAPSSLFNLAGFAGMSGLPPLPAPVPATLVEETVQEAPVKIPTPEPEPSPVHAQEPSPTPPAPAPQALPVPSTLEAAFAPSPSVPSASNPSASSLAPSPSPTMSMVFPSMSQMAPLPVPQPQPPPPMPQMPPMPFGFPMPSPPGMEMMMAQMQHQMPLQGLAGLPGMPMMHAPPPMPVPAPAPAPAPAPPAPAPAADSKIQMLQQMHSMMAEMMQLQQMMSQARPAAPVAAPAPAPAPMAARAAPPAMPFATPTPLSEPEAPLPPPVEEKPWQCTVCTYKHEGAEMKFLTCAMCGCERK